MAELEKSRGLMKDERILISFPDFLKSEQVGNKNQTPQRAETTNQNRGFKAFNSDSNVVNFKC